MDAGKGNVIFPSFPSHHITIEDVNETIDTFEIAYSEVYGCFSRARDFVEYCLKRFNLEKAPGAEELLIEQVRLEHELFKILIPQRLASGSSPAPVEALQKKQDLLMEARMQLISVSDSIARYISELSTNAALRGIFDSPLAIPPKKEYASLLEDVGRLRPPTFLRK